MRAECSCGSGRLQHPLVDAAGIHCTYVCDSCEKTIRARYNPKIFDPASRYAASGAEEDLEHDQDFTPYL